MQGLGYAIPASPFCRDAGLAAIAAEFDLRIDAFEPDLAAAIALGAAITAPQRQLLAA
jgi:hypothetical protein